MSKSFIRVHDRAVRKYMGRLGLELHELQPDFNVGCDSENSLGDIPYAFSPENPANCSMILTCPNVGPVHDSICYSSEDEKSYESCLGIEGEINLPFSRPVCHFEESIDHRINSGELSDSQMISLGRSAEDILQRDAEKMLRESI